MSTVSLQMIVKDEQFEVEELLTQAAAYFDELNITVSDKPTANGLRKFLTANEFQNFKVVWREWNDNFADARNDNYSLSTTDYTFWLDADDVFDFSQIPRLVELADKENIDALYLPYNYAYDEDGNLITRHWRERLVRNGMGFEWRSTSGLHETYITERDHNISQVDVPVVHNVSPDHIQESLERNHKLLHKAVEGKPLEEVDPRDLVYYGTSLFSRKEYDACIKTLVKYLQVGGSVEDSYRAMQIISEAAYQLGQHDHAIEYASKCIVMKPEYPMGYWLLAQYEADQEQWAAALEWVKVSLTKPDPNTLSVYDPSARERAILVGAQAEFMLGNYNNALAYLRKIPNNKYAKDLMDHFTNEADAETFTKLLPNLRKFFESDHALWNALCRDMKYDTRLKTLRNLVNEPKKWSDKSIVIFCGQGYEEWGPHTLDKGMGGSEEAVVYLSAELAKLGYSVYVFGEVPEHIYKDGVDWYPWKEIDTRDEFNVFISWRYPQYLERVNAKVKLADIHDVTPEHAMPDYPDITYLVKSAYHRSLSPHLPDDKFKIIGNGISKEQFKETK